MKTSTALFFILCFSSIAFLSEATTRTVSNIPTGTLAQFNNLQAAVNVAVSGDTILINGSLNNYAGCTVTNKRLTIIGPGWAPDQLINQYTAKVEGMSFTGSGCNGSEIQGIIFVNNIGFSNSVDSIRINRNRFNSTAIVINQGGITYRGYTIEGNYFQSTCCNTQVIIGSTSSVYLGLVIRNNAFFAEQNCCSFSGFMNDFTNIGSTILLDHNLWYGPASGQNSDAIVNCAFLTLTNNIFIRRNVNVSNCTFAHNLTFQCSNNTPWLVNNNTNASGNISNADPQMASQSIINTGGGNSNNPLLDFSIASGPADNAGLDGKDLGLLFETTGTLNWNLSRNSRLPRIYEMTITNPVTPSGGTLNVNLVGKKSN